MASQVKGVQNDGLTLFHYWRSSCSWRVRWSLLHKNIPFESKPINLLLNEQNSPEFLTLNPSGYVPALAFRGEIYGESLAILEWLEDQFPQNPLLPSAACDKMRVRQMCLMLVAGTQPLQNLSVMRHHSTVPEEQGRWAAYWIEKGLYKFEELVRQHSGTFCFGSQLTLADLCLIPQLYNARRFNVSTESFPVLSRIEANCLTLAACEASAPHQYEPVQSGV